MPMITIKVFQSKCFSVGCIVLFFTSVAQASFASEGMLEFDGILAGDIVELVAGRENREHRAHIWTSKLGIAVETKRIPGKSPRIIYLYNHKESKSWIVSPEGKRYCEIPKEDEDQDFVGGILSTRPCLGFDANKLKDVEWNGQVVTVWQCQGQQKEIGRHYYSKRYGVVVKEEGKDGIVRELRNLNFIDNNDEIEAKAGITMQFKPPVVYKAVSVNEIFFAKRPLEKYLE